MDPHHPAVLRALYKIVSAARRVDIPVSVCGEMAHETRYVSYLIGIGVRELSIDPHFMPTVQRELSQIDVSEAEKRAWLILEEATIQGIEALLPAPALEHG